jgi:hypothetical protein
VLSYRQSEASLWSCKKSMLTRRVLKAGTSASKKK